VSINFARDSSALTELNRLMCILVTVVLAKAKLAHGSVLLTWVYQHWEIVGKPPPEIVQALGPSHYLSFVSLLNTFMF